MSKAFEKGVEAGRTGQDPHPQQYNALDDATCPKCDKDSIEAKEAEYQAGYVAGSNQRAADASDGNS